MAAIEERGNSVRVTWLYGGSRGGAKQSCTFNGEDPEGRLELANLAKGLVESRRHNMTRAEVYAALLGSPAEPERPVPTFKQWVKEWIATRRENQDAQSDVIDGWEQALNYRVIPRLGHLRLTEIGKDELQAWVVWMTSSRATIGGRGKHDANRHLHPNTIRKIYGIITNCLGAAVPKWIAVNPALRQRGSAEMVKLPKKVPFDGLFLSPAEVGRILAECHPDLRDLVFVMVRSGLRLGEILVLEIGNVVFPRSGGATILVKKARKTDGSIGRPKSKASRRAVPVDLSAAEVLRRRCAGRKASEPVFLTAAGRPWHQSSLRQFHWYKAVAAAMRCEVHPPPLPDKPKRGPRRKWRVGEVSDCGCEGVLQRRPRLHDLRHTHASALIESGLSGKKVQVRLGHAHYQTTMEIYSHVLDLGTAEELSSLDEYMNVRAIGSAPSAAAAAMSRAPRSVRRRMKVRRSVA